jgi:DNA polymerase I-like protein with 3'-5' exonuclease and polymerase domains
MAKGKRRKERIRAMKLAVRGADVRMDGDAGTTARGGGGGTTTTTTTTTTTDVATTTTTTADDATTTARSAPVGRKRAPTVRRAIAKRKRAALDKALSHVERRGVKADRKKLKRGHRVAARDVY